MYITAFGYHSFAGGIPFAIVCLNNSILRCTFDLRKNTHTMVALKLIGITVVLLGLGFAGIAIKIWAKKDGEFAGTCASQSPFLNKDGETCSYCGKDPNQCETKLEQAS
jgi:hypothetical protein